MQSTARGPGLAGLDRHAVEGQQREQVPGLISVIRAGVAGLPDSSVFLPGLPCIMRRLRAISTQSHEEFMVAEAFQPNLVGHDMTARLLPAGKSPVLRPMPFSWWPRPGFQEVLQRLRVGLLDPATTSRRFWAVLLIAGLHRVASCPVRCRYWFVHQRLNLLRKAAPVHQTVPGGWRIAPGPPVRSLIPMRFNREHRRVDCFTRAEDLYMGLGWRAQAYVRHETTSAALAESAQAWGLKSVAVHPTSACRWRTPVILGIRSSARGPG